MSAYYIISRPSGYLAQRILETLPLSKLLLVNVTNRESLFVNIGNLPKDAVVINAAGFTGRRTTGNIDGCEQTATQHKTTVDVNTVGAVNVSDACAKHGLRLIHIGSGCVFNRGYNYESTMPAPVSWYGWTKAWGDAYIATKPGQLSVRIRLPIDTAVHERNLLTKLMNFKYVVADAPNSLTAVPDLLRNLPGLAVSGIDGMLNYTNPGALTHMRILEIYEAERQRLEQEIGADLSILKFKGAFMSLQDMDARGMRGKVPRTDTITPTERIAVLKEAGLLLPDVVESVTACCAGFIRAQLHIHNTLNCTP